MKNHIFYKKENVFVRVKHKHIYYVVAEGDYVSLTIHNNETVLLRDSLMEIEKTINSDSFFRTHRSWLVNLENVDCIDLKGEWLQINGQKIPISRSRKSALFDKISKLG